MKIAVIGAGNVGGGIGRAWVKAGHDVAFGVQDVAADPAKALASAGATVRTAAKAASGAGVILLATPWPAAQKAIESLGDISGKTLIDATNPLKADFSWLEDGYDISGAERVAGWAHGAFVFKAFNQTGAENLGNPGRYAARPVMFVCGDDAARKPAVLGLVGDAGFEAIDAGGLRVARLVEPYAMLWIHLAHGQGMGRDFAFALEQLQS